ncbi:OmpA family protein [Flavobacterium sp. A45]|uniref:OmpA family protein n=1 Tax=Flavobacterium sp. A45 TaxID=1945862 RepID=UPI00098567AC|nr:OmpA family protein [Flavobacterium sp. A45]OOG68099.1 cell envelope biogenesis protein OmpA [Flavobacterium sp. A45]
MKHLNKLLVAVTMVMGLSSQAQDSNNKWAIGFGVNAIDYRSSAGDDFMSHFDQPFKVDENWNILPSVSYINVSRYVGSGFIVGLTGSINQIDKFVIPVPGKTFNGPNDFAAVNPGDLMYYGVDATVTYSFMELIKSKVIEPTLSVGGGYTFLGDESYGTVNPGVGLNFWFTENVGLSLLGVYKKSFGDRNYPGDLAKPDAPSYTQYSAGLTFKFGAKDTDGDGIYDKDDACPEVAGLKQFNGCPDTDADGIEDSKDKCPTVAGSAEFQGCPDTDGDGVADPDDACPSVAGLKQFQGCPDTDGDGVTDASDKCPTVAGPASNGGCPVLDADKDGVPDLEDACPTVAGPASNKGCPEVTEQVLQELKVQARAVYFNSGKATFKTGDKETQARLDAIKQILLNYPNAKFSIEGHTDSDGSDKFNQKLSEERATAVMNGLIERGVNVNNLVSKGFGETMPVASNKTAKGKAENRRTEIRHIGSIYEGKL